MTVLTDFLAGAGTDATGRRIAEIRVQPPQWLEMRHDFIQWLFPLPEPSGANLMAPLLGRGEAATIAADAGLRAALLANLDAMMRLYGIERDGADFRRGAAFPGPYRDWLGPIDHNHLRFTRMLRCLSLCGLRAEAEGLRHLLFDIAAQEAAGAWTSCLRYWRDAGLPPAGW